MGSLFQDGAQRVRVLHAVHADPILRYGNGAFSVADAGGVVVPWGYGALGGKKLVQGLGGRLQGVWGLAVVQGVRDV